MPAPSGYTLVYQQDFNGSSLPSDWQLGYYFNTGVPSSAVTVSSGSVKLTWTPGGHNDISISTSQTWNKGYFEVRMKWTTSVGAWPAIWFITPNTNPNGEIDMFEGQGDDSGAYFATLHNWNGPTQTWNSGTNRFPISGIDFSQYHTYGLLWEEGSFTWYLDGAVVHTYSASDLPSNFNTQQVFAILSMQEGASWSEGNTSGVTASSLTTEVDYFYVYQLGADTSGRPAISSFTATPSTLSASGSSTLAWTVTGADSMSIDNGVGPVTGSSTSVTVSATTSYTLTATNTNGTTIATVTVTVGSGGGGGSSTSVLIDGPTMAGSQNGLQGDYFRNYGPVPYAGALWSFLLMENDQTGDIDLRVRVHKSTDGGLTWTRIDPAPTTPQYDQTPYDTWLPADYYREGSSAAVTLVLIKQEATAPYTRTIVGFVDFDMSTETFSTLYGELDFLSPPSGAASGAPVNDLRNTRLFKLSSGAYRLVYDLDYIDSFVSHAGSGSSPGGSQRSSYYRDYNPTTDTWASPVLLPGQSPDWQVWYRLSSAVKDGDVIRCVESAVEDFFSDTSISPTTVTSSWYFDINADGSLTSPVYLDTAITSATEQTRWFLNQGIVVASKVLLPLVLIDGSPGVITVESGAVTGVSTIAHPYTGSFAIDIKIIKLAASYVVAWSDLSQTTFNTSRIYTSTSTDGVSWSSPALLVDLEVDTPAPQIDSGGGSADVLNIHTISLGVTGSGTLGVEYTSWAGYYLGTGTSGPPSGGHPPPLITFLCIMFDSLGKLTLVPSPTRPISLVT